MMLFEERYSCIAEGPQPQEIVLLMGRGCFWKQCSFCDYHEDRGPDEESISLDLKVLEQVTGEFGRLVALNSGSYFELPGVIRERIVEICREKQIHHLHMESHWRLAKQTGALKEALSEQGIFLHPRIGIETFDEDFREDVMIKGMGKGLKAKTIAEIYDECCLLFGMAGQTPEQLMKDIEIAGTYFDKVYLNIFNDNTTAVKADPGLIQWFMEGPYQALKKDPTFCVLVENTDLGVGD